MSHPRSVPSRSRSGAFGRALTLAWFDFVHEWRVSACQVLALAAVMTPLLVLFGLKSGVVASMQERLLSDPRNLEVVMVGAGRLEPEWFADMAARPQTAFVVPRTRALSATIDVRGPGGRAVPGLEMIPTAAGDPLFRDHTTPPDAFDAVVLSGPAAQTLGAGPGDVLDGLVARTVDGRRQVVRLALTVTDVLPDSAFSRSAAFVGLDLLVASEDYRDGFAVPRFGDTDGAAAPTGPRAYASARLFARDLDAVAPLAAVLRDQGLDVRTKAEEIATVQAIDRVLSFIFYVLAGIAVGGFLLSLAASLWANVERKRRDLALMRLIGFDGLSVAGFPAAQAVLVAVLGIALSFAVYAGVAALFDGALGSTRASSEVICRLPPSQAAAAAALTLFLSLASSAVGGIRAARVDPAESLRDV